MPPRPILAGAAGVGAVSVDCNVGWLVANPNPVDGFVVDKPPNVKPVLAVVAVAAIVGFAPVPIPPRVDVAPNPPSAGAAVLAAGKLKLNPGADTDLKNYHFD